MTDIVWKNPPATRRDNLSTIAERLKENPGEWAFIGRKNVGTCSYLKKRYGVETTIRNTKDSQADIYARWNGS